MIGLVTDKSSISEQAHYVHIVCCTGDSSKAMRRQRAPPPPPHRSQRATRTSSSHHDIWPKKYRSPTHRMRAKWKIQSSQRLVIEKPLQNSIVVENAGGRRPPRGQRSGIFKMESSRIEKRRFRRVCDWWLHLVWREWRRSRVNRRRQLCCRRESLLEHSIYICGFCWIFRHLIAFELRYHFVASHVKCERDSTVTH